MSAPIRIQAAGGVAIEDGRNNAVFVIGATVPTDATPGFVTGCLFVHTDGGDGTALYVNEGTSSSCDFNALNGA
jgi:hypothetical protein